MTKSLIASHEVPRLMRAVDRGRSHLPAPRTLNPGALLMAGVARFTNLFWHRLGISVVIGIVLCQFGCDSSQTSSYSRDVYPILQQKCLVCHSPPDGKGCLASGLDMTSHNGLMRGTRYGPVVIPGDSRHSLLNMVVEGRVHPSPEMTWNLFPLKASEEATLRDWVNAGAPEN